MRELISPGVILITPTQVVNSLFVRKALQRWYSPVEYARHILQHYQVPTQLAGHLEQVADGVIQVVAKPTLH